MPKALGFRLSTLGAPGQRYARARQGLDDSWDAEEKPTWPVMLESIFFGALADLSVVRLDRFVCSLC